MPLIVLYLAPRCGLGWSLRVIALICAAHGIAACFLVTKRAETKTTSGLRMDFKALKSIEYASAAFGLVCIEFAIFIPITYICSYGIQSRLGRQDAYMLNTYLNLGAVPGRIVPNYLADKLGVLNTICLVSLGCIASIFGLWLPSSNNHALTLAFALIYGFGSGASVSLAPVAIGLVCRAEDYGKRNGTAYTIASVGTLISIPIGGAFLDASGGSYRGLIIFSGMAYVLCLTVYAFARFRSGGRTILAIC